MTPNVPVLIVGAGPTGLVLGCDLARRGVVVRLIDAAPAFSGYSKGKGLQPRTLEVFDDLGIASEVFAHGSAYPRFRLHAGRFSFPGGGLHKERTPTPDVPYPNLWMLPQWRTEALLRQRLEALGGKVELGARLSCFTQNSSGVSATLETQHGTESLRAAFLVGCDGGHSSVRQALGVRFDGEALRGDRVLIADVELSGVDRAAWHVWPFAKGCTLTLCPLPGTSAYQLTAPLSHRTAAPELSLTGVRRLVDVATGARAIQVRSASWISLYRPQVRMVDRYRVGRVLLAGDAAHVHPPAGGQGLNTGVQDAYNLGWKLAGVLAGAPDRLLDSYELERLPVAAAMLGLSKQLHLSRSTRRGPETQQLGLSYRDRPLARGSQRSPGKLSAGDRAPDAPGRDATGRSKRLFDTFRGPHFTLLLFSERTQNAPARELYGAEIRSLRIVSELSRAQPHDWVDADGHARAAYGVSGEAAVLVRPDGYIAAFIGSLGPGAVTDGLERFRCDSTALSASSNPVH